MRWMVATDLSRAADAALAQAYELASTCGGTVTLVHAIPTSHVGDADAVREEAERAVRSHANALTGGVDEIACEVVVGEGPLHRAILDAAAAQEADVLVLGASGHTSLGDRILGSTSERCLWEATLPVLIARGS